MSRRQTCLQYIFLLSVLLSASAILGSTDTLKQGDRLLVFQTISSPNLEYHLRFFTVTNYYYYLGIFYRASVMVWIANRDTPVLHDTDVLTIDSNGTFMITQNGQNPIVLYSDCGVAAAAGSTRVATLHDSGNLVFSELHSNGSTGKILWQSFDHPTDTLLPGMLLGKVGDKGAARTLSLTSRFSKTQFSTGVFALDWDPLEQQMSVSHREIIIWRSGVLKDGIFQHLTTVTGSFKPVISADGNSIFFSSNRSRTAIWKLSERGSLTSQIDTTMVSTLNIVETCYGYNDDNGCVKWMQPDCRSDMPTFTVQQGFFDSNGSDLGVRYADAVSVGPGDCRSICWEDCHCVGYDDEVDDDDIGCVFWRGKSHLKLIHDDASSSIYVISKVGVAESSSSPTNPPQPSDDEGHVNRENSSARQERKLEILIILMLFSFMACNILIY